TDGLRDGACGSRAAAGHVGALRVLLAAGGGGGRAGAGCVGRAARRAGGRGLAEAGGASAAAGPLRGLEAPSPRRKLLRPTAPPAPAQCTRDWVHVKVLRRVCAVKVEVLLAAGVDPDACDHEGFTALHRAAEHGHEELARALLRRGVLRDRQDVALRTALHVASEHGQLAVAELLLAAGWDPARADDAGCTPLHYASQWG
ncbi:Palmitoyltransferase Hip14, partial [Gryllus bimaculatus]